MKRKRRVEPRWLQMSWEGLNLRRGKLMNVTGSSFKNRQLHMETTSKWYLRNNKSMQKCLTTIRVLKRAVSSQTIGRTSMGLDFTKDNLNKAYKRVKSNNGTSGRTFVPFKRNQKRVCEAVCNGWKKSTKSFFESVEQVVEKVRNGIGR